MVGSQILLKSNTGLCLSAGPNKDPSTGAGPQSLLSSEFHLIICNNAWTFILSAFAPPQGNPGATLVECDKTATAQSWTRTSSGTIVNGIVVHFFFCKHDVFLLVFNAPCRLPTFKCARCYISERQRHVLGRLESRRIAPRLHRNLYAASTQGRS